MKLLKNMSKEELELLSYLDIAKIYLKENKTTKNTADLFKEVCKLLELTEDEYSSQIADFFQSLSTSKEFLLLEDGSWDLKSNHSVKVVIDDTENDQEEDEEEPTTLEETEPDDIEALDDDTYLDEEDEDLSDLTIVTEDEIEE